jgi:hypothetical protein
MNIRPFDWRDLPALHRNRGNTALLNSALALTRGPMLVPGALLSYLAPSMGIFTGVCNGSAEKDSPLMGQAIHFSGSQSAHLTFLTPSAALENPDSGLLALLEYLAALAGERGAMRLLAEVDELSTAFESLRRSGFAIYTRQRLWQLTGQPLEARPANGKQPHDDSDGNHSLDSNRTKEESAAAGSGWRPAASRDLIAIRSLYSNLVPGLVQQVEPFAGQKPRGLVYWQKGDLVAYVELRYGHRGIWAQPFVHPDAQSVSEWFVDLLKHLPFRRSRPVYLCVRSYQSWLEPAIEDLGAEAGPRQAVMVKHLAVAQKASRLFALPVLEGGHPEVSAPIVRSSK